VTPQDWIWCTFIFMFGCSIGSFLNVVIYRLPREKSLVSPGSCCPGCNQPIRFYDNIPLLSWILLGAKCRQCKTRISARYFVVELLTGLVFLGLYVVYFHTAMRPGMQVDGGRFVYFVYIILLAAFIAGSGIDLELWIIPLSICWLVTLAGFIGSAVGGYVIEPELIETYDLLPVASPTTGALALGGAIGLGISLLLLKLGVIPRSYETPIAEAPAKPAKEKDKDRAATPFDDDPEYNHRLEACREMLFLLPIVICALAVHLLVKHSSGVATSWGRLLEVPAVAGLLGSVFGYFIGCAVVWGTRVFGTLGFGKEAMGLGDVHLMGAAGAVIGAPMTVIAFFVAPFFGLGWAIFQMFFKKIRQIPYGPFLSFAVFTVMIFHDWIMDRFAFFFQR